jgi:hypothetical protein
MAKLLLNLRNVGDDEYADVCTLLDQHGIAWYRTEPSPGAFPTVACGCARTPIIRVRRR